MRLLVKTRVLVVLVVALAALGAACGARKLTEQEICGDAGCDTCIGLGCSALDGGADAGP